jgi:Glutathione synthase/Ribosomal protein S6 modification enzyme (glutaminyl transferase)
MAKPVLGILTLYLNDNGLLEEKSVYQKMIAAGLKLGLEMFVFTPQDVDYRQHRIHALFYNTETKTWSRKWTKFPHMIFDRCRIQRSRRFEQLKRFRSVYGHLTFLNRPLRNKWTVYRTLQKNERFRPHLPATRFYESMRDVNEMLKKYPLLYLKPINGTGGRGILRIERKSDGTLLIQGRDRNRRIIKPQRISYTVLHARLSTWSLKEQKYLVQQGIHLKLPNGRVHDYRMLVQKNGAGEWEMTGCAGRVGSRGSITSNLHGGGEAVPMRTLLLKWIGDEALADSVQQQAKELGEEIAAYLEKSYNELCELALDLAIDRQGRIWLLEVNPKPAREVFAKAGEKETYRKAIIRPLEYALWVYQENRKRKRRQQSNKSALLVDGGNDSTEADANVNPER